MSFGCSYTKDKPVDAKKNTPNYEHFLKYKESCYGKVESARIAGRSSEVDWSLDDKLKAHDFVEREGIRHPKIYAKLNSIDVLKEYLENQRDLKRFVLKISNQHSAAGVFLLRRIDDDLYFDDITARVYCIDELVSKEKELDENTEYVIRDTYYFVEESVENFVGEFKIPFDYKVYCFNGIPKFIIQMDRNINDYSIAAFDANFIPMVEGRDWFLDHEKSNVAVPIIPPNAFVMLYQTMKIARKANRTHVRVDWFDNGEEPVFGEFTFASGGYYFWSFFF